MSFRSFPSHHRRLEIERLENRRLLAITVDTLVDEIDGSIVDGDVSLRDAIAAATPGETIDFDASLNGGTILLDITNGDIDISDALTMDASSLASGITIDAGNGTDGAFGTGDGIRVFNINDGTGVEIDVTLRGLTLTGGDAGGITGGTGGAEGGAIKSAENLTVADSRIVANFSGAGFLGPGFTGGGIYSEGTLTIENSVIEANATGNGAAGAPGFPAGSPGGNTRGGGISASGPLTISGSMILGNSTGDGGMGGQGQGVGASGGPGGTSAGGGVYATGPTTILNSDFSGNSTGDGGLGGFSGLGGSGGSQGNSQGGALYATGTLAITNSDFDQNTTATGSASQGGGVYTTASTVISSSRILDNQTGDAFSTYGGGIFASAPLTLEGTTVSNNQTGNASAGPSGNPLSGGPGGVGGSSLGGGVYAASSLSVETSTIADNTIGNAGTGGNGFGAGNDGGDGGNSNGGGFYAAGFLTLTASTVSGNTTGDGGMGGSGATSGAVGHGNGGGVASLGGFLIDTSTISGNATGINTPSDGGGIWAESLNVASRILHSTITENIANGDGGGVDFRSVAGFSLTVEHSIVAGNTNVAGTASDVEFFGNTLFSLPPDAAFSIFGTFISNLGLTNNGGNIFLGAGDPLLGALADNGGPTKTHALLSGSPAIDAGDANFSSPPDFDQRGAPFVRVVDGDGDLTATIDIGAFELQPPSADFDIDGDIDGRDFLFWQRGFGTPMPNATKGDGDGDNDLDVDGDDLTIWEGQFGAAAPIVAPALANSDLVDAAIAVALADASDGDSVAGELVADSLPPEFFSVEPTGRNDLVTSISDDATTSTARDDERISPDDVSAWKDAVDEVIASEFN